MKVTLNSQYFLIAFSHAKPMANSGKVTSDKRQALLPEELFSTNAQVPAANPRAGTRHYSIGKKEGP